MKKARTKCTIRLNEEEIQIIKKHPGKNFSDKARSLIIAYSILMDGERGADFEEKYEFLLKGYLEKIYPELQKKVEKQRKELNQYRDTLKALNELKEVTNELQKKVDELCIQSTKYVEKIVADCVVVQKKLERNSK